MKCEYCGRKGETCCDPEVLYQKFTGRCAWCGFKINGGKTIEDMARYFGKYGNCCPGCNTRFEKEKYKGVIPDRWDLSPTASGALLGSEYTEEVPNNKE